MNSEVTMGRAFSLGTRRSFAASKLNRIDGTSVKSQAFHIFSASLASDLKGAVVVVVVVVILCLV